MKVMIWFDEVMDYTNTFIVSPTDSAPANGDIQVVVDKSYRLSTTIDIYPLLCAYQASSDLLVSWEYPPYLNWCSPGDRGIDPLFDVREGTAWGEYFRSAVSGLVIIRRSHMLKVGLTVKPEYGERWMFFPRTRQVMGLRRWEDKVKFGGRWVSVAVGQ
jgi:hypothetical protein